MSLRITSDAQLAKLRKKGLTDAELDNPYELALFDLLSNQFGSFVTNGEVAREVYGMIASRDFRLDIAFPNYRFGFEIDGYADHGKSIKGFQRDREKDLLLAVNGWQVIHIIPKQINNPDIIKTVMLLIEIRKRIEPKYQITPSGLIKLLTP